MTNTGTRTPIRVPEWARKVADGLGKGPHVVVSGISVSGNIHAGNLREVLVAEAVANALRARSEEVRFIFHADTIDPLRKVPSGVPEETGQYIGHSLSDVPDPFGNCHESYAEHFLTAFEEALNEMGVDVEVVRSHKLYTDGFYKYVTREALNHTEELRAILAEVTKRRALLVEDYWSPYIPRSSSGSLHGTRVTKHLPEEYKVQFKNEFGQDEVADYSEGDGKLQWRVELAARWKALGVTFEPFGKDHTTSGGSTETADRMASEVFRYHAPGRYEYEWIGLKGYGDMSSSRGIVLLPKDLLKIMPPNAVRRIILGRDPAKRFDLDLGSGFPRFMDEYRERARRGLVPFAHLATISQIVGDNVEAAIEILLQGGYREDVRDREALARWLTYAQNWSETWAPDSFRFKILDLTEAAEAARSLDADQLRYLDEVAGLLDVSLDGDTAQNALYDKALELGMKPRKAFAAIYTVLLGRKNGPKAGPFIVQIGVWIAQQRFLSQFRDATRGQERLL